MKIERFEDLIAWQKGRALVKAVYDATDSGAVARDFKLRDQVRGAAISVPANVAEGFERSRLREFHQFLSIAKSSCAEVRTYIYIGSDVGYFDDDTARALRAQAEEVARIIGGLRAAIGRKLRARTLRTQDSGLRTGARC